MLSKMIKCIAVAAVLCITAAPAVLAGDEALDSYYEESFDVTLPGAAAIMTKATAADTVFTIATATNTNTTGHGNVLFQVTYDWTNDYFNLLLWSQDSPYGCTGYRKWYRVSNPTFGTWPYAGGAACVGWPPTYNNMHENLQIMDYDMDGDLDVFELRETSTRVWTVYLYKNLEAN